MLIQDNDKVIAKIKGIGVKVSMNLFLDILSNKKVDYKKFMKFKEAVRRNMLPNEIIDMTKVLNIQDDKRLWEEEQFNKDKLQFSEPLKLHSGILLGREQQLDEIRKLRKGLEKDALWNEGLQDLIKLEVP